MLNDRLLQIGAYPFDRLRALLGPVEPAAGLEPIALSLGEPRHDPPATIDEAILADRALWGRYPPMRGTEDARIAIAAWACRRYRCPETTIDPATDVVPVSGTREALFMAALAAVPERKAGGRPVVLMPNPFYQVYLGAAVAPNRSACPRTKPPASCRITRVSTPTSWRASRSPISARPPTRKARSPVSTG